ncbi:MAG: SDR family oxidoreductase [Sulfuricurvum sp.]|uniref:SDR family oxidoreductase n=1 Tax=Sulfuricurvum sp. TaxID=2025608 RepID=UPI00262DC186|nr:SDR family oxidoreductase [Sulfuricurvum sp.]MDD2830491.1 SDR family oxidoreductase [Sulfuricurvum sp.]MDD4950354.1 SDR family oxidoreductase [Sulfuricurvum sp.]
MSKIVLITGTSSGFGSYAAPLLASHGYKVYATMRDISGRNREHCLAMEAQHPNIKVLELELTDSASIENSVKYIMTTEGRIDVLINNAGRFYMGIGESFTEEDLLHIYNVDVLGPWRLIRAVLPYMRNQNSGYIITVTSSLARFSCPFMTCYASAKHALEGLLQGMKYELKSSNIDFTFIEPGIYPTNVFNNFGRGSDTSRNAAYGPMAHIADGIKAQLDDLFASPHANDPMLVARAMLKLIESDSVNRPIRLPVDPNASEFTNRLNEAHDEEYLKFLTASGMGELL